MSNVKIYQNLKIKLTLFYNLFGKQRTFYPFGLAIWGDKSLSRALHSTPFGTFDGFSTNLTSSRSSTSSVCNLDTTQSLDDQVFSLLLSACWFDIRIDSIRLKLLIIITPGLLKIQVGKVVSNDFKWKPNARAWWILCVLEHNPRTDKSKSFSGCQ